MAKIACSICGQEKFQKDMWQIDSRGKHICTACCDERIATSIAKTREAMGLAPLESS